MKQKQWRKGETHERYDLFHATEKRENANIKNEMENGEMWRQTTTIPPSKKKKKFTKCKSTVGYSQTH